MKDNSAEPWCPAVAGAGKLNVTRDLGVGVGGLTDRVWPDELADVVVAVVAVEDADAEPEVEAELEAPPHAASIRAVANTGREARLIVSASDERAQLARGVSGHWRSMGEQQQVEVEIEQRPIGVAQSLLGLGRIVHQPIGHECEIRPFAPAHDAVSDGERSVGRDMQRGLVGADGADLMGDDAAGQLVAERKRGDRAARLELVDPGLRTMDRAVERLLQTPRVAVVVAVGQHDMFRLCPLEPPDPLGGQQRVQHNAFATQIVRADV